MSGKWDETLELRNGRQRRGSLVIEAEPDELPHTFGICMGCGKPILSMCPDCQEISNRYAASGHAGRWDELVA